jgi:uncharacterized membrane protein
MSIKKILSILAISAEVMALSACAADDPVTVIAASDPATASPSPAVKHDRGFIWSIEKGLQLIPQPSFAESMVTTAINNHGDVVGYLTLHDGAGDERAFIWSANDGLQRLGSLVGPQGISLALTIDDESEVHGLSEGPSTQTGPQGTHLVDAFVWTRGAGMTPTNWTRFGDLKPVSEGGKLRLPSGAQCLQVTGASTSGLAVGYAGSPLTYPGSIEPGECHFTTSLMWELDGTPVVIHQCVTGRGCELGVNGVNNRGEVIGYYAGNAFRWTRSGGFVEIPIKQGNLTAINDNGDASGLAVIDYFVFRPLVWMASGEIRTIELPAGATSGYAVGINESGQVTGAFR